MLRSTESGAKAQFPESCMLYSTMGTVTGLLGGVSKFLSPITFAAGKGGFSFKYMEGSPKDLYRCFLFLGGGNEKHPRSNVASKNRENFSEAHPTCEHAAVLLANEDRVTYFGGAKAIAQEAVYTEGSRKFFMYVGDLLIAKGNDSFALNPPMEIAMPGALMFSWNIVNDKDTHNRGFPKTVNLMHDIAGENKCAAKKYNEEMKMLKNKNSLDLKNRELDFMDRLRATPPLYTHAEVARRIEKTSNIFNIRSNRFINGE